MRAVNRENRASKKENIYLFFYIQQGFYEIVYAVFNRCVIVYPELWNVVCLTPIMKSDIRVNHLHALASDDFRVAMRLGTHGAERANLDERSLIRQYGAVIDAELTLSELSDVHMRVVAN